MDVATLIVTALAALFTAIAAGAAWRAAEISRRDAEARSKPHVTVGIVVFGFDSAGIPVKNLGLGPATQVGIRVFGLDGQMITSKFGPGLAPMESEEFFVPTVGWEPLDRNPTLNDIGHVDGFCLDAAGNRYPIYYMGSEPSLMPAGPDDDELSDHAAEQVVGEASKLLRRFDLRPVARAAAFGEPVDVLINWQQFWMRPVLDDMTPDEYVAWVREQWASFPVQPDAFKTPSEVEALLAQINI